MRELGGEHQERRNTSREIGGTFLDKGERKIKNKEKEKKKLAQCSFSL